MKKIFPLIISFAICACTFQTKQRGYVFPEDTEERLMTVKNTADLEEKFGSPLARTVYGESIWIYYGADENYHGPFPLTWDNRKVLLVRIDGNRVMDTKILNDKDLPDVRIASGATPIPAEIQLNMLEELVNNIGRFSPAGLGQ
ncbi:MAG: hypothetical protein FWG80_03940 [Alphaproteobacteria bacterium]|nr:hypothetical protein [Alphaproteobacteria bacterium]